MNCEEFSKYLDDYMQNNLSDEMKADMEKHMASCDKCRSDFEFSKRITDSLHNMTDRISVSEKFLENLNNRIDSEESASEKRFIPDWRIFTGLAAAIIFTVVVSNTDMPKIGEKNNVPQQNEPAVTQNETADRADEFAHEYIQENGEEVLTEANPEDTENIPDTPADLHFENIPVQTGIFPVTGNTAETSGDTDNAENNSGRSDIISKGNIFTNSADLDKNAQKNIQTRENTDVTDVQIPQENEADSKPQEAYNANPVTNENHEVSGEQNNYSANVNQENPQPETAYGDYNAEQNSDSGENNSAKMAKSDNNSSTVMRQAAPAALSLSDNTVNDTDAESDSTNVDLSDKSDNKKENSSKNAAVSGGGGGGGGNSASGGSMVTGSSAGGGVSRPSGGASRPSSASSYSAGVSARYSIFVSDIDAARRIIQKYAQVSGSDYIIQRSDLNAFYSDLFAQGITYSVSKEYDNGGDKISLCLRLN